MTKTSFAKGVLLCQLAAFGAAAFFLLYQSATTDTEPLLAAYALFCFAWIAAVFLALPYYRRFRLSQCSAKNITLLFVLAFASLLGNASIVIALDSLPASSAHLLQRSETLFAVLIGLIFLKEGASTILAIAVFLFCLGIVAIHQDPVNVSGDLPPLAAGLLSAFCFAVMQAATKVLLAEFNAHLINAFRLMLLVMVITFFEPSMLKDLSDLPTKTLAAFALAALVGPVMARVAYMNAAYHIGVARAALFASVSPIFTLLLQFLIFGITLNQNQFIGSTLLLIAVSLPLLAKSRK